MKIRLERIDGTAVGGPVESRRFPFALGQAKECDLRIEAKGVWGRHLVLDDEGENGITATRARMRWCLSMAMPTARSFA